VAVHADTGTLSSLWDIRGVTLQITVPLRTLLRGWGGYSKVYDINIVHVEIIDNELCVSVVCHQGADQCDACRHVQDGPYCVAECPTSKYANASGICLPCHPNCTESAGCTGPLDTVGPGACNSCALVHFDDVNGTQTMRCLREDTECSSGFYRGTVPVPLRGPGVGKLASSLQSADRFIWKKQVTIERKVRRDISKSIKLNV